MLRMSVNISRYVDGSSPGWVECTLVDAYGNDHVFVEKVPVVTRAHLDAASSYPQSGVIACVSLGTRQGDDGRRLVQVDTQTPWGVESLAGKSRFDVSPEQLVAELEFATLEVPGSDVARLLEEYRSKYQSTGQYPFLIGDREDLERLEQEAGDAEQGPAEVIRASLEIDLDVWIARRHEEWREDAEVSEEELLGDWPIEVAEKGSISLHKDVVSGEIKPKVYLGLAEIEQPWQLPAVIDLGGWNECPCPVEHCAFHRSWQERFGAEITGMSGDTVECLVRNPPRDRQTALGLAWEQYWYCNDIVDQGCGSISKLAATLLNSPYWFFWWD